jgi:hypothetical protein
MSQLRSLLIPSAVLAAITLAAAPSFAQEKYHGRQGQSGQASGQQQSGAQGRERAQARSEAPRAQADVQRQRAEAPRPQVAAPRSQPGVSANVETRQQAVPRVQSPAGVYRGNDTRSYQNRTVVGTAVPRANVYAPHYVPHYAPHYAPYYVPRGYGYYGTPTYYRPYAFHPHFTIGFGVYVGYPVPYAYSYPYPIPVYGYGAPSANVMVGPGSPNYGGVALEITPHDGDVYVDGQYAGRVENFDGQVQPLTLAAGVHRIEVQAPGFEPLVFNVDIQPGQVIPYRGDLRPF